MSAPDPANAACLQKENAQLQARVAALEKELAKAALRENELLYKEVFDNISVCMFLVDVTAEGRFQYAGFNPAEEKAVGLSSEAVTGRFVEDVFPEALARKLTETYQRCVDAGVPITYDDELDFPSGRRYFHSNLIPSRNEAGLVHRLVGACIDTTDFRRSQEEALARQKLESLGVLAGGIAHDFNNLLGGMLAHADLALDELAEHAPGREEIHAVRSLAIAASEVVRELMIFAGQEGDNAEPVDLSSLVHEMLQLLKVSISKHATLRSELGRHLPAVRGNPAQLRQVVLNLITNASEAIGEQDGTISLATSVVSIPRDVSSAEAANLPAGDYLCLEVSDTGSGMAPEVQERVFDPYFTTKFAGRGLGLAVVQRIVQRCGGATTFTTMPGHGTTFQVLLPCTNETALGSRRVSGAMTDDRRVQTILVVEDEDRLRTPVSKALRKLGYSVIEAGDGTAASALIRSHAYEIDVVLLDVTLPGTSSRDVFDHLQGAHPGARVILTSAYSWETLLSSFPGLPEECFIRKPFALEQLESLLRGQRCP